MFLLDVIEGVCVRGSVARSKLIVPIHDIGPDESSEFRQDLLMVTEASVGIAIVSNFFRVGRNK